jgi:nitrite reductase (NO-forming)
MMQRPLIVVSRKHVIFVICLICLHCQISQVISPNYSQATAQVQNLELRTKTHEYTLVAEETTLEIAQDVRVDAWTYNGTIPGPTLTATEGDRVIVHFINKTPLPHTVHFHGDHPSTQDGVFEQIMANGSIYL